ncbi:MAG: Flp pilus assembly complex ATPase component TadA [Candidatus Omnitrophica bacterium]|nr:Flp pilus assembly complex ATPase component TadA [Candidatus Omnitrophota bacterium]MCM8793200.1 Flp pilus assembly complex ATPase component TadA [Candidatus Omnitrophota bacterium]
MAIEKRLLGEILLEKGYISRENLATALAEQKKTGARLGQILLKLGFVTEKQLATCISQQLNLPLVDLDTEPIDKKALSALKEDFCIKHKLIPLNLENGVLKVAMADPLDVNAIDELAKQTGYKIETVVSYERQIVQAIDKYYGHYSPVDKIISELEQKAELKAEEVELEEERKDITSIEEAAQQAPIVNLVNTVLATGIKLHSSDIHIEPQADFVRVRYRVDGILQEGAKLPKETELPVISRIKIMSKLDIAERRIPQDGRIKVKIGHEEVDMRVATLPVLYGEKVVMRIIDTSRVYVDLAKIGFQAETLARYEKLISRPHGIILVTGPTGCGKTSTLYASLNKINSPEKNIVTIEDPIEFPLPGINQVQINPKAGLTFASGLRAFLRQDPNIIMVGEIRDRETAEIAVHAALTGHLVFSTLHTNDAPGALTRLIDMGMEPFLVSSSVIGVLAQRLVRLICPECKEEYKPPVSLLEQLGMGKSNDLKFFRGKGCLTCRQTGYLGRTGIFELLVMNEEMAELVVAKSPSRDIRKVALKNGMESLRDDGIRKSRAGLTTLEEVLRVTQEEEIVID